MKLAEKVVINKVSDEFEPWTDRIINYRMIAEKVSVWHCHQNNSLNYVWIFLKLANKVDKDEFSDEFKTLPDQIINLIYVPLIAEKASVWLCHQHNSFSFDMIFLTLADKVDIDEILDVFENWPDRIIILKVMPPELRRKDSVWLCHEHNLFSFNRIYLKLAEKGAWVKSRMSLKTLQIGSLILRVSSPWLLKGSLFDFFISITHSALIRSSWNLQIRSTWMKY